LKGTEHSGPSADFFSEVILLTATLLVERGVFTCKDSGVRGVESTIGDAARTLQGEVAAGELAVLSFATHGLEEHEGDREVLEERLTALMRGEGRCVAPGVPPKLCLLVGDLIGDRGAGSGERERRGGGAGLS
jgi:hypothetical protein